MPEVWTQPITWNVDQLVTNNDLNEQLRDNLEYLLSPNHERIIRNNAANYSITNVTTFQDIDSTNLSISLTTHGGPVLVRLGGTVNVGASHAGGFDIAVDDTRVGNSYLYGLRFVGAGAIGATVNMPLELSVLLTGLGDGTYVLRPQWRTVASDTISLMADASANIPVIFEAIEL